VRSTRRVVTVLFVDICNYTSLTAALGAEKMYSLLDGCLRRLGETVDRFEGTVDKFTGDGAVLCEEEQGEKKEEGKQKSFDGTFCHGWIQNCGGKIPVSV